MGKNRHAERVSLRTEVALEEPGRQVFLPSLNLSSSGIFLSSEQPPEVGTEVRVVLSLPPDGMFLRLSGVVVRLADGSEPDGFAVAFEAPESRTHGVLADFVRSSRTS